MPGGNVAAHHRLRALVQAPEQGRRGGDDDEGDQHRARLGPANGDGEGIGRRPVETRRFPVFGGVALHHRNGIEHFGGNRAGVGHAVLAGARELAHAPPEPHRRRDDEQQRSKHLHHQVRVGDHQHAQRAHAHDRVAQAHAERRAHHRLHQRGVAGQPRQHLAGLRGLKKLRALPHHMRIHRIADVGRDPLAQPADGVEAPGRKKPQRGGHAEQLEKMGAQRHQLLALVSRVHAAVDQAPQRQGKHQRRHRRHDQEKHRQPDAARIRPQKRKQPRQRPGRPLGRRRIRSH